MIYSCLPICRERKERVMESQNTETLHSIAVAEYQGGYFDSLKYASVPRLPAGSLVHENVVAEPAIQVRCFSYEDIGVLVPNHWHNSLEILLLDAGYMELFVSEGKLLLHPGDFAIINSRAIHATNCSEHSRVCVLQIPHSFLKGCIPDYDAIQFRSGPGTNPSMDQRFSELLSEIHSCYRSKAPGFSLHFTSLLYEVLYLCVTAYQLPFSGPSRMIDDEERSRLITVMEYIGTHYQDTVSLKEVASRVALSPEYFCRYFKKNMGITFLEYVNQVRFSHICEDLFRTRDGIMDILSRHGFTNYKLFRRMFHEKYGCTPSQKRKEAFHSIP